MTKILQFDFKNNKNVWADLKEIQRPNKIQIFWIVKFPLIAKNMMASAALSEARRERISQPEQTAALDDQAMTNELFHGFLHLL